jgi:hypothetical protein
VSNLDQQLEDVIRRRKKVTDTVARLIGRKEQAQANLEAVEQECRDKNIDPEKIDDIIEQIESKYSSKASIEPSSKNSPKTSKKPNAKLSRS